MKGFPNLTFLVKEDFTPKGILLLKDNLCPMCERNLALYSSYMLKVCYDCKIKIHWEREEKELPLVKHQR